MKTITAAAIIATLSAPALGAEPEATKPARVLQIMKPVVSEAANTPVALTGAQLEAIRGGALVYKHAISTTTLIQPISPSAWRDSQ